MTRFRTIEFWPSTGHPQRRWSDEPETDAWVRSATRVSELYGEALEGVALRGMVDSMRLVTVSEATDTAYDDAVHVEVHLDEPESWEAASVRVPARVAELSPGPRGRLVLDVIHAAVTTLAPHRDWPLEAIEEVRSDVLGRELPLTWASPWEISPDGAHEARALFRHADDVHGRVVLEIRDTDTEELVARSGAVRTFSALTGFRRAASTLRWAHGQAELVPHLGLVGHADGMLQLDPTEGVAPLVPLDGEVLPEGGAALRLEVVGTRGALVEETVHVEVDGGVPDPAQGRGAARIDRWVGPRTSL
jgi:hypothetical protein